MRQSTTPANYEIADEANATDDVVNHAENRPGHVMISRKIGGQWRPVTAKEFAGQVSALAAGLIAAGIEPGDRVALLSATRYEWMLCDYAVWSAGAVTVPIYETSSAEQIRWILDDSGARAVIVESDVHAALVDRAGRAGDTGPRSMWRIEGSDLDGLIAAGAERVPSGEVERRRRTATADSPATVIYTSGTTGRPKGCTLTHRAMLAEAHSVAAAAGMREHVLAPGSSVLLFLPLAHAFARAVQLTAVHSGTRLGHTADIKNIAAELADFRPTLLVAVPRVLEKFHAAARARAVEAGRGKVFDRAQAAAEAYSRALDGGGPGPLLRVRHAVYDRLVYARLRAALGGRARHAICGSAPLGARLGHFFRGAGVNVLEGWGLTEAAGGDTLNLPGAQRIGTVGRPLPGCTVRIAADGEVLLKAPQLLTDYWRNEAATREVLDPDGWLRTGDLGALDDDGYLTITGRKKDLIVTAAGKNVAPAVLEDRLRSHWLVAECVVVGDRRPYIAALITIDADGFAAWKKQTGRPAAASVADLRDDTELLGVLQEAVDDANLAVSHAEGIKRFGVLAVEFTVGGALTPTQKVRRDHVLAEYAADVAALYPGAPRP